MEFEKFLSILEFSQFNKMQLTVVQNEMLKFVIDNRFLIIYKNRRGGISTAISLYMLWLLIENPKCSIGMLYSSLAEREIFREIINLNLSNLQETFKAKGLDSTFALVHNAVNKTTFPNGSKILYWSKHSENALRGTTLDFVYISELNDRDNFDYLLRCILPCLSLKKNSKFIITTSELINVKEDMIMNGYGVSEYWSGDSFDGKRVVLTEKCKKKESLLF